MALTRREFRRLTLAGVPATIEIEDNIPERSDAVKETATSLQYCRAALA